MLGRTTAIVLLFVFASLSSTGTAVEDLPNPSVVDPYIVHVAVPEAFVRCGPSSEYYRTDALKPGDTLEVYVETEDGWLGVRPPESSYSWVPAHHVTLSKNRRLATVQDPKAAAWVGSNLGTPTRYRWQVRLSQGEQLAVLGERDVENATGETDTWLMIVPPPGEFRWVHISEVAKSEEAAKTRLAKLAPKPLDKDSPVIAARSPSAAADVRPTQPKVTPAAEIMQVAFGERQSEAPVGSGAPAEPAKVQRDIRVASANEVKFAYEMRPTVDQETSFPQPPPVSEIEQVSYVDQWHSGRRETREIRQAAAAPINLGQLATASVDSVQLLVSQQMAQGVGASAIEPLRKRTLELIEHGAEAVDRGRARILLERIEQYQEVARSRDRVSNAGYLSSQTGIGGGEEPSNYDQRGYLVQVYSARPDTPPFALTDRSGRTIAYIAPSAGLNLRRYLNQEVGLYGRNGYLTGLDTPYLVAERVIQLSEVRR